MPIILVAESQPSVRIAIRRFLDGRGHQVRLVHDEAEAEELLRSCDIVLADGHWTERLAEVAPELGAATPIVLLGDAEESPRTRLGHAARLARPIDFERLAQTVDALVGGRPPLLISPSVTPPERHECIHSGPPMRTVLERAARLAAHDLPVLVLGETGTGKELVARHLHASGARARHPFVGIHCGAIAFELLESELFGHVRGAFTDAAKDRVGLFEAAGEGTVFLDEIGELPVTLQAKLLRALQEREFLPVGSTTPRALKARVVAASQDDLAARAEAGTFRTDLLHRVAGAVLTVPPLRERPGDLPALVAGLLARAIAEGAPASVGLEAEGLAVLARHPWPGNVRELENVLRHALVLSEGGPVTVASIEQAMLALPGRDPDRDFGAAIARWVARSRSRGRSAAEIRRQLTEWTESSLAEPGMGRSDPGESEMA